MRTINLHSAFIFVQVVISGSFTAAAQALGLPKSTVSDKVAELEKELGVTLMVRTTRKLNLTDIGKEYFKKAELAIRQIQSASEEAAQSQRKPSGTIRITAPNQPAFFNIADVIAEYRRKFPEVAVEIDYTDRSVDLVTEDFDLAIRVGNLEDSSLIAKKAGAYFLIAVASAAYLKKAAILRYPQDLLQHNCIKFSPSGKREKWEFRNDRGKTAKVTLPNSVTTNSFAAIKNLVALGQGVALMPYVLCKEEIENGKFVHVLPEWFTKEIPVHLVHPPQRYSSPKVREFIPLLERRVRELMPERKNFFG